MHREHGLKADPGLRLPVAIEMDDTMSKGSLRRPPAQSFPHYGQIDLMLRAGAEFASYCCEEEKFFDAALRQALSPGAAGRRCQTHPDDGASLVLSARRQQRGAPLAFRDAPRQGFSCRQALHHLAHQLAECAQVSRDASRTSTRLLFRAFRDAIPPSGGELSSGCCDRKLVNTVGLGPTVSQAAAR